MKLRIKFLITLNISLLKNLIKLTGKKFESRLKQTDLVNRIDFDNQEASLINQLLRIKENM